MLACQQPPTIQSIPSSRRLMASLNNDLIDLLCESRDYHVYGEFILYIAYTIPFIIGLMFSEAGEL